MKLLINIFDTDLVWKAQIDSAESLIHRTSWHEIPNSEMTISRTAQGVEELQIGRILVINNQRDKALIIEDLTTSLDDNYITYNLISLKGMLNYRICHPTDSMNFVGTRQSEVMLYLAGRNLISQTRDTDRNFWNAARTINMFRTIGAQNYGDLIDYTIDWDTGYLGDTIISLAKITTVPLGWNIYITEDFSAFEMAVYKTSEKHINQTILPPVVFSEEFGNIKNATYEYSIKDWRNFAYMIWEDTAETLRQTPVGNVEKGATVSFNRKEIIIDSSKQSLAEVDNEGRSELNKRPHVESFTAEIINNEKTMSTYKDDWDLGDIVTIQSKRILKDQVISIDAQITEIEEIYASGEYSINATFGEGTLTLVQLVKNAIEQKK
jgi:hypothetical protein